MAPNILQLQREVESLSDERLLQEAQMPNMFPAYLTQQEMVRREQERNAYQARKMQQPGGTVHDRLIERAMSGIGSIPQQLSPEQEMFARQALMEMSPEQMMQQQMMMQQPQPMADGGLVGYQHGGYHNPDDWEPLIDLSPLTDRPLGPTREESVFLGDVMFPRGMSAEEFVQMKYGVPSGMGRRQPITDYGLGDVLDDVGLNVDPWSFLWQGSQNAVERPIGPVGENHSGFPTLSGGQRERPEGIASLQAPAVQRQELDLSQYFQMTPEEQAVLDRARADAQSLESRIDTEADRLSAQANILSNVARAMARGQVPTISEPLRELQTAQRGRREGIMDESRAMEVAALAQEAGLSRAEQEALMERAIIGEERDYQEAQRQRLTEEKLRFAGMLGSEDEQERLMARVMLGISSTDATGNALLEQRQRLLGQITELAQQALSGDTETMPDLRDYIVNMYSEQAAALGYSPERLRDIVEQSIIIQKPESRELFNVEAQLSGAANGGLFKDTYQIEF